MLKHLALTTALGGLSTLSTLFPGPAHRDAVHAAPLHHARVSSVAVNPRERTEVWVCNRGNDSVSVVDTIAGRAVAEIDVGVWPRSLAFTRDGRTLFVANQRGNVPVTASFISPFDGTELRGTVSVIDVATRTVTATLTDVGTEPYGLAVSPNGRWFAVTGFRSATVKLFRTRAPHAEIASFAYEADLNFIAPGSTVSDVDSNSDFLPDLGEPRALAIRSDGQRIFVTHATSGFVSVLDVNLDTRKHPVSLALVQRIDLNTYTPHPIFEPTPVRTLASQGVPRALDDIVLSPDGRLALVPHVLHNVNHDVNHDFGPDLVGDFANRVHPALTLVDAEALSYAGAGDRSARLHHRPTDPAVPAEHVPYGEGLRVGGSILGLGASGAPVLGGSTDYTIAGSHPLDLHYLVGSTARAEISIAPYGTLLNTNQFSLVMPGPTTSLAVPDDPSLEGVPFYMQGLVFDGRTLEPEGLTNGVTTVLGSRGAEPGALGRRAGHPGRVLFGRDGDRALLLNRGSEDVFLYSVEDGELELMTVFPPRHGHVERAALDASTPLGDLPLGMALVYDEETKNRDALLYVVNETSRTLSSLRVELDTGVIWREAPQIPLLLGDDQMTLSQRMGQELFEDASRAQTAGNFNNSCHSCHFEGGTDGNVWQRPDGPRSTMPVYGGSLLTGLILWKGVRLNLGETGPMFGGENGGHGVLSDAEQQALVDYHAIIPVPLNPNLDVATGEYTELAALGRDLYFGTNETGENPTLRSAGCANCHPDLDGSSGETRGYTFDFLLPELTLGETLGPDFDPSCFSLQQNIVSQNLRKVNSGVNVDIDRDGMPDLDRNADGFIDIETYVPMNPDTSSSFERDDTNSYMCDASGTLKSFDRDEAEFSIPTKLGVFSTGPYFHDHSVSSLRAVLDPEVQTSHPVYGDPGFPGLNKLLNEFHDVRGNDTFVANPSKVQITLKSLESGSTPDADIEALLAYIASL